MFTKLFGQKWFLIDDLILVTSRHILEKLRSLNIGHECFLNV